MSIFHMIFVQGISEFSRKIKIHYSSTFIHIQTRFSNIQIKFSNIQTKFSNIQTKLKSIFHTQFSASTSKISRANHVIICLYYYPLKVCNFHMQIFQVKQKYYCSELIKLQKFLMQQYIYITVKFHEKWTTSRGNVNEPNDVGCDRQLFLK